jgi:hypothetical protein
VRPAPSGSDGAPTNSVATDTIAIFESDAGWNASGTPEQMLPATPRHLGGDNFGHADGSVYWVSRLGAVAGAEQPSVFNSTVPGERTKGPAGRLPAGARSP